MSNRIEPNAGDARDSGESREGDALSPLPGERGIPSIAQRERVPLSRKRLFALGVLVVSLASVAALSIHRFAINDSEKSAAGDAKQLSDKPAAAGAQPRKLEMPVPTPPAASPSSGPRIPALLPTAESLSEPEPIGVRRTGSATASRSVAPEDAPVMLVTSRPAPTPVARIPSATPAQSHSPQAAEEGADESRHDPPDPLSATARNLDTYKRQLQGLLDTLSRTTAQATRQSEPTGTMPPAIAPLGSPLTNQQVAGAGPGLFGGQLQGSATQRVSASALGHRSLTLPKGTAFTCALKTRIISAASGLVGCQVQRNVYSDDGRVLLIERGSHIDGEYRIASVRTGTVRIPVLWTRIRTPHGITVDVDSPATGALGESGIDGYVDNRWAERIGAAMLLSLIDDSVKLTIANQASERGGDTVVLQSTTESTSKLAEKVLDSTINIPPLIYQNQGGIVGIYVARDVDFSSVYELRPTDPNPAPSAASAVR